MRKLIVTSFVTLDGVMEAPNEWSFPYWNDEIAKVKFDELMASDVQLLGRVTYEGFAAAWPTMTDEQGFADKMNSMPKYVVSTTLKKAEWNNSTVIKANVPEEIARLKQPSGGDILVAGSATLIKTLMQHGLVDEYTLLVYPLVAGKGLRLFGDGIKAPLKLIEARATGTGVTLQRYAPDQQ
jgi:dihydrofolate reductase